MKNGSSKFTKLKINAILYASIGRSQNRPTSCCGILFVLWTTLYHSTQRESENLQAVNEPNFEASINLIEMILNNLCRNQRTAKDALRLYDQSKIDQVTQHEIDF